MRWRSPQPRWSEEALRVAAGYVLLATLATALALAIRDGAPWVHPEPWVHMTPALGHASSALLGLIFAAAIIATTRIAVARYRWARRLHREMRPFARDLSAGRILMLAGLSSLGEELLFRGALTPVVGVAVSAVIFGLLHQMKGPSRWVWAGWATGVGVGVGSIFALTGSLVGPLVAHGVVNTANLLYLRDHDPSDEDPERYPA